VEAALATHPVAEAAVIGVPDEVYGEAVAAPSAVGAGRPDAQALIEYCRTRLAGWAARSTSVTDSCRGTRPARC
jgi:long-chain acyl-CoA synthetase